jgi:hypothetical protein
LTSSSAAAPEASPASPDTSTLYSTLGIFAHDQRALGGWLSTFRDAERALDVARQSYWHPNGFAKLVLLSGPGYKVRLHVWPAGTHRLGESNPHGHRWNFASTVLCGDGLRDVHYAEAETGVVYERYQYAGGNAVGALTHVRTVHLVEKDTHVRGPRDRYALDTSVVHTVQPLGTALIATLVVQGAALLDSTPVYGIPGVDVDEPGREISADEVRELIRGVLEAPDGPLSR